MWKIEDLEWREYLAYSIICGYIWYNEPKGYGALEFAMDCFGVVCIDILLQTRNWILQLPLPSNRQMRMLDLCNDAH